MLFVTFQRLTVPRMGLLTNVRGFHKLLPTFKIPEKKGFSIICISLLNSKPKLFLPGSSQPVKFQRNIFTSSYVPTYGVKGIQENISSLHMKKRPLRKKRTVFEDEDTSLPGFWNVKSLATADEYNLEGLMDGLIRQDLYLPEKISTSSKSVADAMRPKNYSVRSIYLQLYHKASLCVTTSHFDHDFQLLLKHLSRIMDTQ